MTYQVEVYKQGALLTKLWTNAPDSAKAISLVERQLSLSPKPVPMGTSGLVNWTGYEFVVRQFR